MRASIKIECRRALSCPSWSRSDPVTLPPMTDWQLFSFGARALVPSRVRLPITVTHSRPARTRPDFTAGFAIVAAETGGRTGMEDAVEVNDGGAVERVFYWRRAGGSRCVYCHQQRSRKSPSAVSSSVTPAAGYCASVAIEDDKPFAGEINYRVRVEQRNRQRAWSNLIWVQ